MKITFINIRLGFLLIPIFFICSVVVGEIDQETVDLLHSKKNLISYAANKFDVNPSFLASIVYTERYLNYDWTDKVFDQALAMVGKNSSIGFCQVKLKTAYYIEKQLADSLSDFYPGEKYKNILGLTKNPYRLIERLQNDSLNILYAAAYLRIIQSYWSKHGFTIDDRPEIIGSLYQLGLFQESGKPRQPHFNPRANNFGKNVLIAVPLFIDFDKSEKKFVVN